MKSIRRLSFTASVIGVVGALSAACGTSPAPTSVVCTDFRAGADLSSSTFGVTGDLARSYGAFAQAAGDLSAVANEMLRSVSSACQDLSVQLGADPREPRVIGLSERDAARRWCAIAAERFAAVRPQLAHAHFAIQVITPRCTVDTSFQLACESRCRLAPSGCTEPSPEERCPVEGREGICPGACTGTCTGSETAPATCTSACNGTCFGTCEQGEDQAECATGCACTTTCTGTCTAACTVPAPGGHCNAVCSGSCSEPMLAQTCTRPLAPPKCSGDVDCQKSCGASSSARAACPDGSLAVIVDPAMRKDWHIVQIVAALERNLPPIFLAARGHGQTLANGATDVLDTAGHLLSRTGELGPMGAACGILIGETSDEARQNLNAALAGSKAVADAVR